jgi:putative ABC transport system permease protein
MHGLVASFRRSVRRLLKSPGFTIIAVLVLGFGIGVNTAVFSLIDTVLLKPLPYPESDRLAMISMPASGSMEEEVPIDYADYVDFTSTEHSFSNIGLENFEYFDLNENGATERINGSFASASAFEVNGLHCVLGRPFTAEEDRPGGPLVAVVSEPFWRVRYHSDPAIIGKTLVLNGQSFQIIGVIPPEAENRTPPKVYLPLNTADIVGAWAQWNGWRSRDAHILYCFGRLKPGVSIAQAQAELEVIHHNLIARYPEDKGYTIRVVPLLEVEVKDYATTVWILGAAVACLLIISTANVATLLLARALDRKPEITIRATLGASRFRLARELLAESIVLSFFGGFIGVLVAFCVIALIKLIAPADMPRGFAIGLDAEALLFFFVVAAITALLSGLLPAVINSKANLASSLRAGGSRSVTTGPHRQRTQSLLMIVQVALACVMLIAAGLLLRSLQAAQSIRLGFNPSHVLTTQIYLTDKSHQDPVRTRAFFGSLLDRVRQIHGVVDAAVNDNGPFSWEDGYSTPFLIPSQPPPEKGREPRLDMSIVSSGYFQTLQIPILAGRDFNAGDQVDRESVVIISKSFAQRFFPNENPLGKQIENLGATVTSKMSTIIGVVDNVVHGGPDHHPSPFDAYYPFSQQTERYGLLLVRTLGEPTGLTAGIKAAVESIDPAVHPEVVSSYDELISTKFATRRLSVLLVSLFSAAALFLAAIGLYGILAYSVTHRAREIGIRTTLGADHRHILNMVVIEGFRLIGIGLLIGIGGALVVGQYIRSVLYGVSPTDLFSLAGAIVLLGFTGFLACLLPALRATKIDPIVVLRE